MLGRKHVELLLIKEGEKNTMFLSMISIDSCLIIHYRGKKHFCRYCFCIFLTKEILKRYIFLVSQTLFVALDYRWSHKPPPIEGLLH